MPDNPARCCYEVATVLGVPTANSQTATTPSAETLKPSEPR
ncbi:TPA: hypothetical protein ACPO5S_001781 [Haemophilus influenzae]